jgi:hypothetical protein
MANHAEWIAGAVRILLSHFYIPDQDAHILDEGCADWIEVLEPFSQKNIELARKRWIGRMTRRPSPAEIKKMCFENIRDARSV